MRKKSTEKRANIRERLCHSLDIQPDIFAGGTLIEIRGRNSVTVRGGGCITAYTDREIRIMSSRAEIRICGERLCCSAYCRSQAVIDGSICSISFEEVKR